jgi:DNA polymerase epsilon subunit 2
VVSLEALESALDTLLAVSSENQFETIQIFNAFETPYLHFNANSSSYELKSGAGRRIHAGPDARLQLLRNRYGARLVALQYRSSHSLS